MWWLPGSFVLRGVDTVGFGVSFFLSLSLSPLPSLLPVLLLSWGWSGFSSLLLCLRRQDCSGPRQAGAHGSTRLSLSVFLFFLPGPAPLAPLSPLSRALLLFLSLSLSCVRSALIEISDAERTSTMREG